jgi:GNAT superfamily N-acetyltransferase
MVSANMAIEIKPFSWEDWYAMWQVQAHHLAEGGIRIDLSAQGPPDFTLVYDETNPNYPEMDMERIDEAYLKGRGNFWLAWVDGQAVGFVGAQDMGDYVELRRMYVWDEYRRLGIASLLVQALIAHCRQQQVAAVRLWTESAGPGRFLYAKLGFRQVELEGSELSHFRALQGEIRMRLNL